jgi:hypothetical protein
VAVDVVCSSLRPVVQTSRGEASRRFFDDRSPYVDRFGLLLIFTGLAVVLLALVDLDTIDTDTAAWAAVGVTALVAVTLSLALRASGLARRLQHVVDVVLVIGVTGLAAVDLTASAGSVLAPGAAPVLLAALAPAVVVRRLLRHRVVSRGTLLGAISAYLLIALAFFHTFLAVDSYLAEPFFGQDQPTTAFMYFSLTTITTLGYGDLAPVPELARLLATTEAVIGQVYLVTVVAMVVGLLAQRWRASWLDSDEQA